jgi:hypothetical protein
MARGLKACRVAELQQLPVISYQLLLLAAQGHKAYLLQGLCAVFDHLQVQQQGQQQGQAASGGGAPALVLQQVQGTVLMHISNAVKYDQALGQVSSWLARPLFAGADMSCCSTQHAPHSAGGSTLLLLLHLLPSMVLADTWSAVWIHVRDESM